MIDFTLPKKLYVMPGDSKMRQPFDITTLLIQSSQVFHPDETAAYLFCNGERNVIRIIYWDTQWFLDLRYPIHQGRLRWPSGTPKFTKISLMQLERLLRGDTLNPSIQSSSLVLFHD